MSAAPWPPPKRTMDPREIVTGDVRGWTSRCVVSPVRSDRHVLTWPGGASMTCCYFEAAKSMPLISRPMWGDQ